MDKTNRLRWMAAVAFAFSAVPGLTLAADTTSDREIKALENRVRAIEHKLSTDEQTTDTESKSVKERIDAIEQQVKDTEKTIAEKLGVDFHTLIETLYEYNINSPDSGSNTARVFDNDANSFTLQDAALFLQRNKPDEALGFMIDMDFGKVAQVVGSVTCWNHSCSSAEQDNAFELREAYLTYKIPVGNGINLKAGKFVTLLGYEVLPTWTTFNPNISNSIIFGFGIPFTHTGLLADIPLGDIVTIDAGIVNGWDDVVDNNDGKTFLGGIGITPADFLSAYISGTYGPEQPNNGHSKLGAFTAVFTLKATDWLTFVQESLYANESDFGACTTGDGCTFPVNGQGSAVWYGFSAYGIVQATESLGFALRSEVFVDNDGVRGLNSIPNPAVTGGETVWEITPTIGYQLTNGLLWRAEYRHDESNKQIFQHQSGFVRGQDTLGTELVLAF
jgi:hypothetical protein